MKKIFAIFGIVFLIWFVLFLAKEIQMLWVGVMLLFLLGGAIIYTSINREEIIKIIIKIVLGIVLLLLTCWIYPDGIMSRAIASVTVGDIVRLLMVVMFGIAFIVDIFF